MNYVKTSLLLAVMTALFGVAGYLIGGATGLAAALALALFTNGLAYWFSDRLVLKLYGALPVRRHDAPMLFDTVKKLAKRAGIPMPGVYVINEDQPNAFAVGRSPNHAAVAVTTGLMHALRPHEVGAVIAHELAHIKNRDTLIMTVAAALGGAISAFANVLVLFGGGRNKMGSNGTLSAVLVILFALLAPMVAFLIQMAISREREFKADAVGAVICGQPLRLAFALRKIRHAAETTPNRHAENNPATAHLFIFNPLRSQGVNRLFSTHPSTRERVRRLERMAVEQLDRQFPSRRLRSPRRLAA